MQLQSLPEDYRIPSTRQDRMRPRAATSIPSRTAPSMWRDWVSTSVPFAIALLLALILVQRRQNRRAPARLALRHANLGSTWSRARVSLAQVPAGGWGLIAGTIAVFPMLAATLAS